MNAERGVLGLFRRRLDWAALDHIGGAGALISPILAEWVKDAYAMLPTQLGPWTRTMRC